MIFDTNQIISAIRRNQPLPIKTVIPIVVAGELEAFALKADWGYQKIKQLQTILNTFPIADIDREITMAYALIDAYSQGKLKTHPLSSTARNMGKNDIWIAATALYLDFELHTSDNDFDHLIDFGLKLVKY